MIIDDDDDDGQMIVGDLMGLKLSDIRLTGEEKPRKNLTQALVPTGDRTRTRCVRSAHATTCPTAVDCLSKLAIASFLGLILNVFQLSFILSHNFPFCLVIEFVV